MNKQNFAETKTLCIDNLYVEMFFLKHSNIQHKIIKQTSNYFLLVSSGSVNIVVGKSTSKFNYPNIISVSSGKNITIQSLEDDTIVYKIQALRDSTTNNIIDPSSIPEGIDLAAFGITNND